MYHQTTRDCPPASSERPFFPMVLACVFGVLPGCRVCELHVRVSPAKEKAPTVHGTTKCAVSREPDHIEINTVPARS